MKAFVDWMENRTGLAGAVRECNQRRVAGGVRLRRVWPSLIVFTFVVQVATGLFLWMFYSPSAQTAWESVYHLQYEVAGGWLLRGIHHDAAQVLVGLIGLYLVGMIFSGRYRPPREFVFWGAVLLGLFSLALCLTGDLLAWDENSYTATLVRVNFLTLLPKIGSDLFKLAAAGPQFGHRTLTQFFALHAGLFAGIFCFLLILWLKVVRRADREEAAAAERTAWYWPDQALLNMVGCLVVMAVVGLLVFQHGLWGAPEAEAPGDYLGASLGAPADPVNLYAAARPEWSLRGVYQFSELFPGNLRIVPIFIVPACLVVLLVAMPLIGRWRGGHGFNMVVTAVLVVGIVGLSAMSYWEDHQKEEHQRALAAGLRKAARVKVLARGQGIPPTGALTLLRNDPKTQGPILYRQHCAACHAYRDAEGNTYTPEKPSAPDLTGFAGPEWLAGFLDAKRIGGPGYYGNTALADGEMADFVGDTLKELRAEGEVGEEALADLIACLVEEAKRDEPRPADEDKKTVEGIDEDTLYLFEDFTCTDCHRFYHLGNRGDAPELTGYGSRDWLIGLVSDPTHQRYYSDLNDRMPSYHKADDDYTLSTRQIEMLVDWMRGRWYEPESGKAPPAPVN